MKNNNEDKTKERLRSELEKLRQRISELEKLENIHREAEEEKKIFQSMVESARDAIFFKDRESRYLIVNNKTLDAFSLPRKEVIGKNDYELMSDRVEARKNVEDDQIVFQTGKPKETIKQMTGGDGKKYWFQAIKVPQFDDQGNVMGLVGIARDITERKQAEEKLKRSEERFRKIFDQTKDCMFIETPEGKILDVNKAVCSLLGYSKEELLSMRVGDVVPPELASALPGTIQEKTVKEGVYIETEELRKDGKHIPVEVSNTLVEIGGEKRVIAIIRDITDRKRAEDALKKAREELEMRVEERTVELVKTNEGLLIEITDRKQAEEELKKYRGHLEELVEKRTAAMRRMVEAMAGRVVQMSDLKMAVSELRAQLKKAGLEPVVDEPLTTEEKKDKGAGAKEEEIIN